MKAKVFLLSIAIVGFLSAVAQKNSLLQDRLNQRNSNFEYPEFEKPKLPTPNKIKAGQDWWAPDTINFFYINFPRYRIIFKYNSQGFLQESIYQEWENNSWINYLLYTYTYDSNNNMLSELRQRWDNSSWVYYSQITRTYDSNNNMLTDWGTNSLIRSFTYDSINNNILTELWHRWENNSLTSTLRFTYTYDPNNNLLNRLCETMGGGITGQNSSLSTYTYDSNNNVLTYLYQNWNSSDNSWVDESLTAYTYDCHNNLITEQFNSRANPVEITSSTYTYDCHNNMLTKLVQQQLNNSGVRFYLTTCTYDSNNNLLSTVKQDWYNNSWRNGDLHKMTYDENSNGLSAEYFHWIGENWQPSDEMGSIRHLYIYYNNMQSSFLGSGYKMTASFIKVSDIDTGVEPISAPELNDISIYPNPTTGELRMENGELTIKDVHIFDIFGRKIINYQLSIVNSMDISHLPAGIYFVRITTEKGVVTKKIIKK